jgi:hypothetical protein
MYDVEYQSHGFRQAYKCGVVILINNYPPFLIFAPPTTIQMQNLNFHSK